MPESRAKFPRPAARISARRTCDLCFRRFKTESNRDEHMMRHDKMNYMCPATSCYFLFETFQSLKDHHRHSHMAYLKLSDRSHCCISVGQTPEVATKRDRRRHKCGLCPCTFFTKRMRDYHVEHHAEMKHICSCGAMFLNMAQLRKHRFWAHEWRQPKATTQNVHPVKVTVVDKKKIETSGTAKKGQWAERLTCSKCQRKFTSEERRINHEAIHDKMIYKCTCGNMFLEILRLISHSYHSHGVLLRKNQCSKYLVKKTAPKLRLVKNGDTSTWTTQSNGGKSSRTSGTCQKSSSKSKCHLCNRKFESSLNALDHISRHEEMVYECPRPCGNQFLLFHGLQQHTRDVHKVFISERDKDHLKIRPHHASVLKTRSESLNCGMCGRRFHRKETF